MAEAEQTPTVPREQPAARATFHSILFQRPEDRAGVDRSDAPACFRDLHLDQVVASATAGRDEYRLTPFFHASLADLEAITYRHEVFQDLERQPVWDGIAAFAQAMRSMREHLAQAEKLHYTYQQERWFLDAVRIYTSAVATLLQGLACADIRSHGFLAFREYLAQYVESTAFTTLVAESDALVADLAEIAYCLHIQGNRVTVSTFESDPDYAAEVHATFQKFRQGEVQDYRATFSGWPEMNHVEAGVLERVALLYPDTFQALDGYHARHRLYLDQTIADFDREVQFYVAYRGFMCQFAAAGLAFCYPRILDGSKEVSACQTFDLALANKLIPRQGRVVCNTFSLQEPERIVVVTGPNQGGKTTFARTFGQLHYLASLGCPVPGQKAELFLFDRLFTHFEREEDLATLRGKLEDDLIRIHDILSRATPRSLIILNEIFTSTTFRDALSLSTKVLRQIIQLDCLCVCVTFLDELASLSPSTVSMVSTVAPEDPTVRTYKIVRRPADGRAYAAVLAAKYGLSHDRLRERIAR